jgi:hypothetical protein
MTHTKIAIHHWITVVTINEILVKSLYYLTVTFILLLAHNPTRFFMLVVFLQHIFAQSTKRTNYTKPHTFFLYPVHKKKMTSLSLFAHSITLKNLFVFYSQSFHTAYHTLNQYLFLFHTSVTEIKLSGYTLPGCTKQLHVAKVFWNSLELRPPIFTLSLSMWRNYFEIQLSDDFAIQECATFTFNVLKSLLPACK